MNLSGKTERKTKEKPIKVERQKKTTEITT